MIDRRDATFYMPKIGGIELCQLRGIQRPPVLPTIHACKYPCFWEAVGKKQPAKDANNYLFAYDSHYETSQNLYLNLIDPKEPLFKIQSFLEAFKFLDRWSKGTPVVVHCNVGKSRSASIVYAWLARIGYLDKDYVKAAGQFGKLYPAWNPGDGILMFVNKNWEELTNDS